MLVFLIAKITFYTLFTLAASDFFALFQKM